MNFISRAPHPVLFKNLPTSLLIEGLDSQRPRSRLQELPERGAKSGGHEQKLEHLDSREKETIDLGHVESRGSVNNSTSVRQEAIGARTNCIQSTSQKLGPAVAACEVGSLGGLDPVQWMDSNANHKMRVIGLSRGPLGQWQAAEIATPLSGAKGRGAVTDDDAIKRKAKHIAGGWKKK